MKFVLKQVEEGNDKNVMELELGDGGQVWAVPGGLPLTPESKKLAVLIDQSKKSSKESNKQQSIWDSGEAQIEFSGSEVRDDLEKVIDGGFIKFHADGRRLSGEFSLIQSSKMHGRAWYLVNNNRADAGGDGIAQSSEQDLQERPSIEFFPKARMPKRLKAMHASQSRAITDPTSWYLEPVIDGERVLVFVDGDEVTIKNTKGKNVTTKYKDIVEELKKLRLDAIFDGVITDKPDHENKLNPTLILFDVIYHAGRNLKEAPYQFRRKHLENVLESENRHIEPVTSVDLAVPSDQSAQLIESGTELVAKRKLGTYVSGSQSLDWVEIGSGKDLEKPEAPEWKRRLGKTLGASAVVLTPFESESRDQLEQTRTREEKSKDEHTGQALRSGTATGISEAFVDSDHDGIPDKRDTYFYDRDRDGVGDRRDTYFYDANRDGVGDRRDTYFYDANRDGVDDDLNNQSPNGTTDQNVQSGGVRAEYVVEALAISKATTDQQINLETTQLGQSLNDDGGRLEDRITQVSGAEFARRSLGHDPDQIQRTTTGGQSTSQLEQGPTFEPNGIVAIAAVEALAQTADKQQQINEAEINLSAQAEQRIETGGVFSEQIGGGTFGDSVSRDFGTQQQTVSENFVERRFQGSEQGLAQDLNEPSSQARGAQQLDQAALLYDEIGNPVSKEMIESYLPPGWGVDDLDSGVPRPNADPDLMPGNLDLRVNDPRYLFHDARLQPIPANLDEFRGELGFENVRDDRGSVAFDGDQTQANLREDVIDGEQIAYSELRENQENVPVSEQTPEPEVTTEDLADESMFFGPIATEIVFLNGLVFNPGSLYVGDMIVREQILKVRKAIDDARTTLIHDVQKGFSELERHDGSNYVSDPHEFEVAKQRLKEYLYQVDARADLSMNKLGQVASRLDSKGQIPEKSVEDVNRIFGEVSQEIEILTKAENRITQMVRTGEFNFEHDFSIDFEPNIDSSVSDI